MLGKNCKYILDINDNSEEFTSELSLDIKLEKLIEEGAVVRTENQKAMFAIDRQAYTLERLEEVKKAVENHPKTTFRKETTITSEDGSEVEEEIVSLVRSIGVTRFIANYGKFGSTGRDLITPFNIEAWKDYFRETKLAEGYSRDQIEEMIVQQEEKLWPALTAYGTEVHNIIDLTFQGKEYKNNNSLLSQGQINQVIQYVNALKEDLKAKYGQNAQFLTEVPFVTKYINDGLKQNMEVAGYDSINGKADLIVIDDYGNAHIFDFKVSRKDVGDFNQTDNNLIKKRDFAKGEEGEWPTTKKGGAKYQLALYQQILGQYGIRVNSTSIIPIKLDFSYKSEFEINELTGITTWTPSTLTGTKSQVLNIALGEHLRNVNRNMLTVHHEVDGSSLQSTVDIANAVFPGQNIGLRAERTQATIENLRRSNVKPVRPGTQMHNDGFRYVLYRELTDKEKIPCSSEQQLIDALTDYADAINAQRADDFINLSIAISSELSGNKDFQKILDRFPAKYQPSVQNQLEKYFKEPGWHLNADRALTSFGIFIFERNGDLEIVSITNDSIHDTAALTFGDSLLGATTRNPDVGSNRILPATYANINIMKALIYVAQNQESFQDKKIIQVRAFNPWNGTFADNVLSSQLVENYEAIRRRNSRLGMKPLSTGLFHTDPDALIRLILSKGDMLEHKVIDFDERYDTGQIQDLEVWVNNALSDLRRNYPILNDSEEQTRSEAWGAYHLLTKMQNHINGITMQNETKPEGWISYSNGSINLGTNMAAAQFSPSHNIREFAKLNDRYTAEVRTEVQKQGHKMQMLFQELGSKETNSASVFKDWFKLDENDDIHEDFELIDPDEGDFKGSELSQRTLRTFLETLDKIRYPNAQHETDIQARKDDGRYYKVPLTEAVFSRQVKGMGVFGAVRSKWDQYRELTEGVFAGDTEKKRDYERENRRLYNKFDLDFRQRADLIRQHGVGFFETDMEIVFNQALQAYTRQRVSEKYYALYEGMKVEIKHMMSDNKNNLSTSYETLEKLIKNRFLGENIMSKDLQGVYKILSVISRAFSTMKLGLNVRSYLRETLSGMYIGATRTMAKQPGEVSVKSWNDAVEYIVHDLPNNFKGISLTQQLNAIYGMANYSLSNITNQRTTNWLNISNWGHDTMFVGCSAPDFQHRMSILIGRMMDDGCWEAHSLNEEGQLVYDFKKDRRFEVYNRGERSDPNYVAQRALYLKNIEEWNAQGYRKEDGSTLKEGDDLPQAYTNREGQSIKNYADILYGHYDDESRSLMNDTFIGSFFMQFKTFFTAKLEQWIMKGGVYNVEYLKQQYDPITGEKLYEIIRYPNEDGTGMPYRDIIKESELATLSEEDKKNALPYYEWTGQPMEGMAQGIVHFMKALRHFRSNPQEWQDLWNNPHQRGLLLLGLSDTLLMGFMLILIKALYGAAVGSEEWKDINRDVRDSNYFASLTYNVLRGVTGDQNIINVVRSMTSDFNPPFVTNLIQAGNSAYAVLCGNQSIAYALTSNVGAISDFKGMVKAWEEATKE